jgi:hypothetical protein
MSTHKDFKIICREGKLLFHEVKLGCMKYRYIMIATAMLIVCVVCVSAITISSSIVSTGDGKAQSTTSTSGYSSSTELHEHHVEVAMITSIIEEADMKALEETDVELSTNCNEASKVELIVRFEPEYFEDIDGALNALAMEEAGLKAHSAINATVLSDLTEIGMPGLQLVELPDDMSLEEGIAYYESLPGVRFAEPNYQISIHSDECAEDESIDIVAETSSSDV